MQNYKFWINFDQHDNDETIYWTTHLFLKQYIIRFCILYYCSSIQQQKYVSLSHKTLCTSDMILYD